MLARVLSSLAAVATACACAGCFAAALPPTRTDVASTFAAGSGKIESGVHVASGIHYASATLSHHVPIDVGAGYVFEQMSAQQPGRAIAARASGTVPAPQAAPRRAQGFYVGAAAAIGGDGHQRSWAGGRAQLVFGPDGARASLSARLSWELFTAVEGSDAGPSGCGFTVDAAAGTAAAGLFVESGVQVSAGAPAAFVTTVGVSVRLPFMSVFVFDPCKL